MNDEEFENIVADAIDHIPNQYTDRMKHVAIVVDDEPTQQQREKLGLRHCDALFGLYEGIPLPNRGGAVLTVAPDKITIFKHPMTDIFKGDALRNQVYKTLWHEVAHYFGLNHDQIHAASNKKKQ